MCLLCDTSTGTANWSTACGYSWNWDLTLGGKHYSSNDAGQIVAKIPTLEEIATKCHSKTNEWSVQDISKPGSGYSQYTIMVSTAVYSSRYGQYMAPRSEAFQSKTYYNKDITTVYAWDYTTINTGGCYPFITVVL